MRNLVSRFGNLFNSKTPNDSDGQLDTQTDWPATTNLHRLVIPTIAVQQYPQPGAPFGGVQAITVHAEHRLGSDSIDTYTWEGSSAGPESKDLREDMLRASNDNWSQNVPLGFKKRYTHGGSSRLYFYEIDSTNSYLEQWFAPVDMNPETVESTIQDIIAEFSSSSGMFTVSNAINEATKLRPEFIQKSMMV